jgi:hypothetical protein
VSGRYGRRGGTLTPLPELVGKFVAWSPKMPDGKRASRRYGYVDSVDAEARTITISVQVEASMWQPQTERTVTIPLSHGPFVPVGGVS